MCRRSAQCGLLALSRDAASTARSAPASPRRRRHQSRRRLSCEMRRLPYPPHAVPCRTRCAPLPDVCVHACATAALRPCPAPRAACPLQLHDARLAHAVPLKCRPRLAACSTSATAYPSVPCAVPPTRYLSGPVPPSGRALLRGRGKSSRVFPSVARARGAAPPTVAPAPAGGWPFRSGCV